MCYYISAKLWFFIPFPGYKKWNSHRKTVLFVNVLLTKAAFLCFQLLQGTIYSFSFVSDTKSCGCNSHPSRGRKLRYSSPSRHPFSVATHTPHGDGNDRCMPTIELYLGLQLTPLTGTETGKRLYDLQSTCVATHTPHGDGNLCASAHMSSGVELQLTPLTGTETRNFFHMKLCQMLQLTPLTGTETR